jgi:hypothetical protein
LNYICEIISLLTINYNIKMKKVLLTLAIALTANFTFAQRVADHSVRLNSPTANTKIRTGVSFTMNFTVKNNGPDVIKTTDTLIYVLGLNNVVYPNTAALLPLNADLNAGDSVTFQVPNQQINGGNGANLTMCAYVILNNRELPDTIKDNVLGGNNRSCISIVYSGTGIGELTAVNNNSFISNVYPNPASSEIFIEFNSSSNLNTVVNIYDMQGKLVNSINTVTENEGTQQIPVNVSELSKGIYTYTVSIDGKVSSNKFVVE